VNKKKVLNELSHKKEYINEVIASIRKKVKSLYGINKKYLTHIPKIAQIIPLII
jgi:phosphoserine aminotransferase